MTAQACPRRPELKPAHRPAWRRYSFLCPYQCGTELYIREGQASSWCPTCIMEVPVGRR